LIQVENCDFIAYSSLLCRNACAGEPASQNCFDKPLPSSMAMEMAHDPPKQWAGRLGESSHQQLAPLWGALLPPTGALVRLL